MKTISAELPRHFVSFDRVSMSCPCEQKSLEDRQTMLRYPASGRVVLECIWKGSNGGARCQSRCPLEGFILQPFLVASNMIYPSDVSLQNNGLLEFFRRVNRTAAAIARHPSSFTPPQRTSNTPAAHSPRGPRTPPPNCGTSTG